MEGINGFVTAWHALATKSHCHVLRLVFYLYLKQTQCKSNLKKKKKLNKFLHISQVAVSPEFKLILEA